MGTELHIRGATLYDGAGNSVANAAVVARDGRITFAGRDADAPKPAGDALTIDAGGRWLLPGLIDCHVHLCFDGLPNFEAEAADMRPTMAALKAARNAVRAQQAGITTVRDLGGIGMAVLDAARAQRRGIVGGARITTAGEVLTITGGHAHFIGREVDTVDEVIRAVRDLRKHGADCIKLVATGGVLTSNVPAQRSAFTDEQIAAAVREAHEAGMRVAAHAIGAAGIEAAVRAGVDSIEHGCFLTDEAMKLMGDGPTWLVPTLVAPHQIAHGGEGVPAFALEKSEEVMVSHHASFRRAVEAGIRIASGTDAGTPFNPHGGLWLELKLMHDNGMPLDRVVEAATSEAAALLGRNDLGVLKPGAVADAVLLDADPLASIDAYRSVRTVVQDGIVVSERA